MENLGKNEQVYALSTDVGGHLKLSIHSPDICQFGFERRFRERHGYGSRFANFPTFFRWKRKQAKEGELVPVAKFLFPTNFLITRKPAPRARKNKLQVPISPAPGFRCVEVLLASVARTFETPDLKASGTYKLFCWMPLGSNETCLMLARTTFFDSENTPIGKQFRLPDEWTSDGIKAFGSGETLADQGLLTWTHPKDFEVINFLEISGMDLVKNSTEQVNRHT